MPNLWMVRAGRGSENIEEFVRHGIVALGDDRLGPLPPTLRKDDLLRLYAEKYPEEKEGEPRRLGESVHAASQRDEDRRYGGHLRPRSPALSHRYLVLRVRMGAQAHRRTSLTFAA